MHGRIRHVLTGAVLLTGLTAVVPLGPPAEARTADPFGAPRNYLRVFAQTNGGTDRDREYTRRQAINLAKRHDLIVGVRWSFDDHVAAMHRANPRLTLLAYMNGAMSRAKDRRGMPERWFLHDANGNRVRSKHFDLHYMMPGNPGWRDWVTRRCREWLRLSNYDGCFLDDMGSGNLGVNLTAWPIDPRTGKRMTEYNWITYARGLSAVVNRNVAKPIATNSLNNGRVYFSRSVRSRRMLDTAQAAAAEGWLRGAYAPPTKWRSVARWKQDVNMLVDAGRRGRSTLLGTKIWVDASRRQVYRWRRYTFASLLLGTDGRQFLNFNHTGPGKPSPRHRLERFDIGRPVERYHHRVRGVYQRRYTRGLALVNPGGNRVTFRLGRPHLSLGGHRLTRVTMHPHSGTILRLP